nr:hypothetical protein [Lasius neglectus picorna-like virus 5]
MHLDGNMASPLLYTLAVHPLNFTKQIITVPTANLTKYNVPLQDKYYVVSTYGTYVLYVVQDDQKEIENTYHILCLWAQDQNYFPYIKTFSDKGVMANIAQIVASRMVEMVDWASSPVDTWGFTTLNEYYTESEFNKQSEFTFDYTFEEQSGTLVRYPNEIKAYDFYGDSYKFLYVDYRFQGISREEKKIFRHLTNIAFPMLQPNQYRQLVISNRIDVLLPSKTRQIVLNCERQYNCNEVEYVRQSYHGPFMLELISGLKEEFKSGMVEITMYNNFNANYPVTIRINLANKPDQTIVYAIVQDDNIPKYGTLRYPAEMLEIVSILAVNNNMYQQPLNTTDFISNVIIANAGMAAAMIGGGLLSGIGQGLGAYGQSQMTMEMQKKQLAWLREQQGSGQEFQRGMQGSMFDFQSSQQQKLLDFQFKQQAYTYQQQQLMQAQSFRQQDKYQLNQNQFTKELVESNTDADIRRAKNAQQLAGYRTDGAVYGLAQGTGRGGLGHPDAPVGATLMPRSVSTQTNSPNVYLTKPTGNYVGPMSNRMDF